MDSGEVNHAKTTPLIGDVNATSIMANASGETVMAETNKSALEGAGDISPRLNFLSNSGCHTALTLHIRDYSDSGILLLVILYGIVS